MNSLSDILDRVSGSDREQVAVVDGDRSWTWGELDERSDRVARCLAAFGVARQERVGVLSRNRAEFYEILFGAGRVAAVVAPVNWRLTPDEMAAVIDDSGCRVLFLEPEFAAALGSRLDQLRQVVTIVMFGPSESSSTLVPYEEWLTPAGPEFEAADCAPDDVALQIYTSGTTGLPKGVMNTHANVAVACRVGASVWDFDGRSVNLVVLPQFHNSGSVWSLIGMASAGRTIVLRVPDAAQILEAIERHRITNVLLVPSVLKRILEHPGAGSTDFSNLRNITYGGSPASSGLLRRCAEVIGCPLVQSYALSETTGQLAILGAAHHDAEHAAAAGWPSEGTEVRIVDPESGEDMTTGASGEIWVRSATVMKGYWHRPEATAAALTEDGWLRTGDIGYADQSGCLFLLDRVNDMIVSGGENVFPREIEQLLERHPQVREAAVIGVPDDRWGEAIKAVVVADATVGEAELLTWSRERLASFKCPKSIDRVEDELPRNPTGKLLRRQLREPYWAEQSRSIA